MPHMDLSEGTFKMPQHLLIQMLKVCSILLLVEMSLQKCPNIHTDDDFTDIDSSSDIEEILNSDSDEENKLLHLKKMGFSEAEVLIAMERCGPDSSIAELTDFICADQVAKTADALLLRQRKLEKKLLNEYDHAVHLSIPMIGSGVPTEPDQITQRTFPEDAIGSPYFYYEQIHLSNLMIGSGVHTKPDQITQRTLPKDAIGSSYFYYENVALAPVNVWTEMSQNKATPLEPDEVEMLLEVTFYCLGILLKTDVQELNDDRLEQLMSSFVEFDLVVSGIQRNNLTGRNKHHQGECHKFNSPDFLASWTTCLQKCEVLHSSGPVHSFSTTEVDFGKVGSFKLVQYVASGFH
ncbi:DNA (Cytosine-5)-methyltransferase DRM1/2 isoform 2 [Hibiscus syriacus]|uniref:DNA (Cytosine-5)-methyltransferase DRM1/2 isoform 2 n=1 Tax=Hibiscus syriacus TaxID=106335 RepID=A0A6A2ZL41_HIBSY|nr:DNA (Cytosine-5)-methyltransferase DRM1/2 isoform 2 [Hibiscus syriacus]